jgi:hypothetical protein
VTEDEPEWGCIPHGEERPADAVDWYCPRCYPDGPPAEPRPEDDPWLMARIDYAIGDDEEDETMSEWDEAKALATALRTLGEEYPTDEQDAPTTRITIGEHALDLQPGQVRWLLKLTMDELATCRNAHLGESDICAHCGGTGAARP